MKKTGRPKKNADLRQYTVMLDSKKLFEFENLLDDGTSRSEGLRVLIQKAVNQKMRIQEKND